MRIVSTHICQNMTAHKIQCRTTSPMGYRQANSHEGMTSHRISCLFKPPMHSDDLWTSAMYDQHEHEHAYDFMSIQTTYQFLACSINENMTTHRISCLFKALMDLCRSTTTWRRIGFRVYSDHQWTLPCMIYKKINTHRISCPFGRPMDFRHASSTRTWPRIRFYVCSDHLWTSAMYDVHSSHL